LRLRFDARELTLLRGAEQLRGAGLAHLARPDQLRTALNLAKAGRKLGRGQAGGSLSLEEGEVRLLVDALRYATDEVHWLTRTSDETDDRRRDAILHAFPELTERGVWRSFGLAREIEALAARLQTPLNS
jgi:hypothetical protein